MVVTHARVRLGRSTEATTDGDVWECDVEWARDALEIVAGASEVTGYAPSRAAAMAVLARDRLGAVIVEIPEAGARDEPGVVY